MKFRKCPLRPVHSLVTPCVGVWIEIVAERGEGLGIDVTPCVGVWIEMFALEQDNVEKTSHSLRGSVD